jgi:hypothetical protein
VAIANNIPHDLTNSKNNPTLSPWPPQRKPHRRRAKIFAAPRPRNGIADPSRRTLPRHPGKRSSNQPVSATRPAANTREWRSNSMPAKAPQKILCSGSGQLVFGPDEPTCTVFCSICGNSALKMKTTVGDDGQKHFSVPNHFRTPVKVRRSRGVSSIRVQARRAGRRG